jgi:hypothetical protein
MILICYDASPDAEAAIQRAGQLFPGESATVLTVWQPFVEVLAQMPSGFGMAPGEVDYEAIDTATRQSAEEHASRTVIVVPSPDIATAREQQRRDRDSR